MSWRPILYALLTVAACARLLLQMAALPPYAGLDEPVLDGVERPDDAHGQPGLFGHLSHGRLFERFTRVRGALRQGPGHAVALASAATHDQLTTRTHGADDDAAG